MKTLVTLIFFIASISASLAEPQILRAPVNADYSDFLKNADSRCDSCSLLLTVGGKPEANTSSLVYVRSQKDKKDETKSEIQAAYFQANPRANGGEAVSVNDFLGFKMPTAQIADIQASEFHTGNALRSVATRGTLQARATMIVSRSSPVDTSILIRNGGDANFIVEQASEEIDRFVANMEQIRNRRYSQDVTVFDFTPRSDAALKAMELSGPAFIWRFLSGRISSLFSSYGKAEAIGPRSKAALLKRLSDPTGGVVVLYAHSDGTSILLDTDDGVVKLTPDDISAVGKAAGGRLPPIILLNCETRPVLAPAFLSAGSPLVMTTDQQLGIFEAGNFIAQFAKALYIGGQDVIDAYYTAQKIANPTRLRPIAMEGFVPKKAPSAS